MGTQAIPAPSAREKADAHDEFIKAVDEAIASLRAASKILQSGHRRPEQLAERERRLALNLYALPRLRGAQADLGEAWREEAACRGMDTSLWFAETASAQAAAKSICAGCPVNAECREFGKFEPSGIWGGLGVRERQRYRAR